MNSNFCLGPILNQSARIHGLIALGLVLGINICSAVIGTITGPINSPINGHVYYLLSAGTWNQAETAAVAMGGHLATIRNAQEDQWVFSTFIPLTNGAYTIWNGLNDAANEGNFVWSSGETWTYTHWAPGEPRGAVADEDYVNYFPPTDYRSGLWNDAASYDIANGVVEVVPEPSVLSLVPLLLIGLMISKIPPKIQARTAKLSA